MPIVLNGTSGITTPGLNNTASTTTLNTVSYTWPASDGTVNTYLKTNGSGTLSWSTVATGAQDYVLMFSYGIV
jgi:hypothetical protein